MSKQLEGLGLALPFSVDDDGSILDSNGDFVTHMWCPCCDGDDEKRHALAELFAASPELADALKECADDLEAELTKNYTAEMRVYRCIEADYRRDMRPVIAARAALAKAGA